MKKLFFILLAAISFVMTEKGATAQSSRNDVVIAWDQLSADASLRQYKKANKQNQIEILHNLLTKATDEFYKCKTLDDIDYLNDQMDLIRFFNNQAKMKSTSITAQINSLQRKIDRVVREYTGTGTIVIEGGSHDSYSNWGQDIE